MVVNDLGLILAGEGLDGGDTLANEGTYFFLHHIGAKEIPQRNLLWVHVLRQLLDDKTSKLRRCNSLVKPDWTQDLDRGSRDQLRPFFAACATNTTYRTEARRVVLEHLKRGFLFTYNTRRNGATKENHGQVYKVVSGKEVKRDYSWKMPDFTGPEYVALMIRAAKLKILYPLLGVLDLFAVGAALLAHLRPEADTDCRNQVLGLAVSQLVMPTPFSWLASKIYKRSGAAERVLAWFSRPGEVAELGRGLSDVVKEIL
jgi:hypothetical protein